MRGPFSAPVGPLRFAPGLALCLGLQLLLCTACVIPVGSGPPGTDPGRSGMPGGFTCQTWFGITHLDEEDQDIVKTSTFDATVSTRSDFSAMPLLGMAIHTPMQGDVFSAGAEGGLALDWWYDTETARNGAGVKILETRTELGIIEFFVGGYMSADLGDAARIYAGAGPMVMLGILDSDIEETNPALPVRYEDDESDAAIGAGLYARAGLELFVSESCLVGLGVRKIEADLDFGRSTGKIDYDGVQFLLTWTFRF